MGFGLYDGRDDGEYNGTDFVMMSKTSVVENLFVHHQKTILVQTGNICFLWIQTLDPCGYGNTTYQVKESSTLSPEPLVIVTPPTRWSPAFNLLSH